MNVARPADGLLSAAQTIALLDRLREQGSQTERQLVCDLAATHAAPVSRTTCSIATLRLLGVIQEKSGRFSMAGQWGQLADLRASLGELLANLLADRIRDAQAQHCLGSREDAGQLCLDSMTVPNSGDGLLLWLIGFGVVTRAPGSRHWPISTEYTDLFMTLLREANNRRLESILTPEQLAAQLEAQARQGAEAEEWVLSYERQRLDGHPLLDQIQRISVLDAAAGYDVASFTDHSALNHDLFIEVKSYSGPKRFYWSRNEIERAGQLGENYAIYLVDMQRRQEPGYAPQIVRGPYAALFLVEDGKWLKRPAVYEVFEDDRESLGVPNV